MTPPAEGAGRGRERLLGIALLIAAVACFACLDAGAKWVNRTSNPVQTAALRYLGSFAIVGAFLNPWARPGLLRTRSLGLQCARASFLLVATVCSFFAFRALPLTEATAITFASPLIVAVLAGPVLGERLGARRRAAVLMGFAGVLVITRPVAAFRPAAALALAAACANALYSLTTRRLAGRDRSETTLFYTGLVGSALFLPVLPFVWDPPASAQTWLVLGAVGAFASLGHWLLILAHARAPASVLAPFFYAQLLWAAVLGGLVFGEAPDRWTVLGALTVAASGLAVAARDRA